jgi:hypothetical protein
MVCVRSGLPGGSYPHQRSGSAALRGLIEEGAHPTPTLGVFGGALAAVEAEFAEHEGLFEVRPGEREGIFDPAPEARHVGDARLALRIGVRVGEVDLGQRLHLAPDFALAGRAIADVPGADEVVRIERTHEARALGHPAQQRVFIARAHGGHLVDELPGHDGGVVAVGHLRHAIDAAHHALDVLAIHLLAGFAAIEGAEGLRRGLARLVALHGLSGPGEIGGDAAVILPAVREHHDGAQPAFARGGEHAVEVIEGGFDPAVATDAEGVQRMMGQSGRRDFAECPDADDLQPVLSDGVEHGLVVLAFARAVHHRGVGAHEAKRRVAEPEARPADAHERRVGRRGHGGRVLLDLGEGRALGRLPLRRRRAGVDGRELGLAAFARVHCLRGGAAEGARERDTTERAECTQQAGDQRACHS